MKKKSILILVIALFVIVSWASDSVFAVQMYWANYYQHKIQLANLDGSGVEDLVTTTSYPVGIALDVAGNKMYWTTGHIGKIQSANLDGSGVTDIFTGLDYPHSIALDIAGGKMFWTDGTAGKIQRANLDGSGLTDLVTGVTGNGIALDLTGGKMYWADGIGDKIQCANLDGSGVTDLFTGLGDPYGIALDVVRGKIYWTDGTNTAGKVQRANLDGSGVPEDLVTGITGNGIALDLTDGKMYWTDSIANKIQCANLDGSGVTDLVTSGLSSPIGIALGIALAPEPPCGPEMVFVPGGEFEMGDHHDEISRALPVHTVTLDSFYMSKYEITNRQYCAYLNDANSLGQIKVSGGVVYAADDASNSFPYCDPCATSFPYSQINYSGGVFSVNIKGGTTDMSNHPIVGVSWYGCIAYSNWKSLQEGLEICYNLSTWECDFSNNGFRLPTEAQWEYAARGGEHSPYYRYPWGDSIGGSMANYWPSVDPFETGAYPWTSPLGYYDGNQTPSGTDMANGYGLYDMAGNALEWCNDWYDSGYYSSSPTNNPTGPASSPHDSRVLRGGGWDNDNGGCRAAIRFHLIPGYRYLSHGFRIVRTAEPPDPVAYWPFDGDANDTSSNGNHGTLYGATLCQDRCGNPDSAYCFDGVDDYIDMGTPSELRITGALTAEAWFFADPEALNGHPPIVCRLGWDTNRHWCWGLRLNGGMPQGWISQTGNSFKAATGENVVDSNTWHHLAMTYKPSEFIQLYLDGSLVAENTTSIPGSINNPEGVAIYVGAAWIEEGYIPPGSPFPGKIDEVRIYDRALSACEIQQLIEECPPPCLAPEPVAYWPFDGDANDASGNGNDGVVNGASLCEDRCGNPDSAYCFDGVDDYIDMGTPSELRITGALTASAWFLAEPEQGSIPTLVSRYGRDLHYNRCWRLSLSDEGRPETCVSETGWAEVKLTGSNVVSTNIWHHLAMTYEPGTSLRVYLDGILAAETTSSIPGSINNPEDVSVYVGAFWWYGEGPGALFKGTIDEVRIYNRALSACEIEQLIENCSPIADAGGPYIEYATSWFGASVGLDGTNSNDPDGDAITYEWDLDLSLDSDQDGDPCNDVDATDPAPESFLSIGQTDIALVVIDEHGLRSERDTTTVTVSFIEVAIDIKPGSFPNAINMGSNGVVPVAFLTDWGFDASTVDPATVTLRGEDFADGLVKLRGKKDAPVPMANIEDVDADGDLDLVVHLQTEKLAEYELEVICEIGALTYDGYVVSGSDTIHVVPE